MNLTLHARLLIPLAPPANLRARLWRGLIRWLTTVPPNPLVWYAPADWPGPDELPKTTVLRRVTLESNGHVASRPR